MFTTCFIWYANVCRIDTIGYEQSIENKYELFTEYFL